LENALALDDSTFWGALPMLEHARDLQVRECATRLRNRQLPKCIDIRHRLISEIGLGTATSAKKKDELKRQLERSIVSIESKLERWAIKHSAGVPKILTDRAIRDPYKRFEESKGPLNQIHIRLADRIVDVASCSSVVEAVESFELFRAYADDDDAKHVIDAIVKNELRSN
jgi:hypothetical protein